MVKRDFPETLIPPGINDERSRAMLGLFKAMAEDFDFAKLLMRNAGEIPDDALPLAVHDFSLEEFFPPDGLPVEATRKLIDRAWDLHEWQGTDRGVTLGLALLGIRPQITHWFEQEPPGHHDTHDIKVYVGQHLYEGAPSILNDQTQRAALQMIDATKRWSQDTSFALGARFPDTWSVAAASSGLAISRPEASAAPNTDLSTPFSAASAATGLAVARCGATALPLTHHTIMPQIASAATAVQILRTTMEASVR